MDNRQLMVLGTLAFTATDDAFRLVDFLNRNLKDKNVVFGLSKSHDEANKLILTLYRSDVE